MFDFLTPEGLQRIAMMAPGLLVALVCHEVAHGYVAYLLGDPTAKSMGRLTLNPLKHLDPIGTLAFFFVRFGWGKPVPINARYFKNPRQGMMLTALAGPATNFLLAAGFATLLHFLLSLEIMPGSLAEKIAVPGVYIAQYGVFINLILGLFNLIPIPPLDGSNVLAYFLPPQLAFKYMSLGRYGFIILIGIILVGNWSGYSLIGQVILPMVYALANMLGVPL